MTDQIQGINVFLHVSVFPSSPLATTILYRREGLYNEKLMTHAYPVYHRTASKRLPSTVMGQWN